jgi:hypothetical protein
MVYLFLFLLMLLPAFPCQAATIHLEQAGWPDGTPPLRISFTGQDADGDGTLVVHEITDFLADWSTPAGVETEWRFPDIEPDGFVFRNAGDYLFFTRNAEYSLVSTAFEGEALSSVFDRFLFPVASSTATASEVPEPQSAMLFAAGLAVLAAARIAKGRLLRAQG